MSNEVIVRAYFISKRSARFVSNPPMEYADFPVLETEIKKGTAEVLPGLIAHINRHFQKRAIEDYNAGLHFGEECKADDFGRVLLAVSRTPDVTTYQEQYSKCWLVTDTHPTNFVTGVDGRYYRMNPWDAAYNPAAGTCVRNLNDFNSVFADPTLEVLENRELRHEPRPVNDNHAVTEPVMTKAFQGLLPGLA